jgi:MFS transporter, ACS family, tartrate transporter
MSDELERATMRKVSIRLLPILFVLYIASYLDRTNVSIAALQMNKAIGLSSAAYGFGAGVFFIGYGLLEVPSNLFLARFGARRWIARIAVTWGILACAMMFVRGTTSFYVLRFLLGAAEAGAFPGIIFYLSNWFPERQRGTAMSKFMVSVPVAGVIGGPLGGTLLGLDGRAGLAGWQWLFLVEGVPSIVLGIVVWFVLVDRPADAKWLTTAERDWLTTHMAAERERRVGISEANTVKALTSGIVWWLAITYFLSIAGLLGPLFFGPVLLSEALHISTLKVGYLMGVISLAGVAGMLVNGAHSDRSKERILHAATPMLLMMVGFIVTALSHNAVTLIGGLALISFSANAIVPVFWCVPSTLLSGTAAAGGIALINSIGNLGGFAAPSIIGWGKALTGNYVGSMLVLAAFAIAAGLMMLSIRNAPALKT